MQGLKQKILLSTIIPILFVFSVMGSLAIYNKYNDERSALFSRFNSYRLLLESGNLGFDTIQDKKKLDTLLDEKVILAEIIKSDKSVVFSSEGINQISLSEEERQYLDNAFKGIETIKKTNYDGQSAFSIITPLIVNNNIVAVLHQVISTVELTNKTSFYAGYIVLIIFIGMVICYTIIFALINRIILKNIYKLEKAAQYIGEGNLDEKIDIKRNDEIGKLASTFEKMAEEIKKNRSEIEEYSKRLEKKVEDKTVALQSQMKELERINAFMVDREIKMVELKKRVQELEEKK